MNNKKVESEEEREQTVSADENRDIASALAYQFAESTYDKTLADGYIGRRRELTYALMAFARLELNARMGEFVTKNKCQPTSMERIKMIEEIRNISFVKEVLDLRTDDETVKGYFDDHTEDGTGVVKSEDAWNRVFHNEMPKIEELLITIGAAIPEILPLTPPLDSGHVVSQRVAEEIRDALEEEEENKD